MSNQITSIHLPERLYDQALDRPLEAGYRGYVARLREQTKYEPKASTDWIAYNAISGDYSGLALSRNMRVSNRSSIVPNGLWEIGDVSMVGQEATLVFAIDNLLRITEEDDGPVIILDVGGMAGVTWQRLAKHFEENVLKEQIAFVISNLGPLDVAMDDDDRTYLRQEYGFIASGNDPSSIIHYVQGNSWELAMTKIQVGNRQVGLFGHVGLIHERLSLSHHSNVPDVDVPRMLSILGPNGIYFCYNSSGIHELEALEFGRNTAIQDLGLSQVTEIEAGPSFGLLIDDYYVLRSKSDSAPKVWA